MDEDYGYLEIRLDELLKKKRAEQEQAVAQGRNELETDR